MKLKKLKILLKPFEFVGKRVQKVVNFILLTVVYILGVGLTSIIAKIFRKHFLDLNHKKESNWHKVEHSKDHERMT